jgi:hypothetical protein
MEVSKVAPSCNKKLLVNEKSIINIKASMLKKNKMELINDSIQEYVCNSIDWNAKKAKKRKTAKLRRANSK